MELSGAIVAFRVEEAVLEGPDEEGVKKLRTQQLEVLSLVTDYLCAASEELGIVDEIVEAVRGTVPTLSVVGHADTVGSKAYNQALSERRARTVRDAIKAQGVDTSNSSVAGRSELDLAVPTGDGVAEPLNRRVTVEVQ